MKRRWKTEELVDHWTLLPAELTLLANKTGATRLGFAVLLKSFQVEARFPQRKQDVPGAIVVFVAKQVGVAAEEFLQAAARPLQRLAPCTSTDAVAFGASGWVSKSISSNWARSRVQCC